MSFIANIFHFTKAYVNAEIFQDTRADMVDEHSCYTGDPFVDNKVLPLPENKLHGWIFYKELHGNEGIMF